MTDDELLEPRSPLPNDSLRADMLARTSRRIRAARRIRTAARVGLCILCFATGAAVMRLRPEPEPKIVYIAVPEKAKEEPPAVSPVKILSPAEIELAAEQILDPAEAARRFREAGDRYLREQANYQAALRCYRNFLDSADPADMTTSTEDTWLLTSLKRAREQENSQ
jgi:hypothetical protein